MDWLRGVEIGDRRRRCGRADAYLRMYRVADDASAEQSLLQMGQSRC